MATILNQKQKEDIITKHKTGITKAALARAYGVFERTIGRVINAVDAYKPKQKFATIIEDDEVVEEAVEEANSPVYNFLCTPTTITITQGDETQTITDQDSRFKEVFQMLMDGSFSKATLERAFYSMSKKKVIEKLTFGNIEVDAELGQLVYTYPGSEDKIRFPGKLTARIISAVAQGVESDDFVGLINFAERLAWNPDPQVIHNLYDFLFAKDIKINRDGYVVCYKKVNERYYDIYTNKIDNSPGKIVRVKRDFVDADPSVTCSHGLHVCSWSYLSHYGTASSNIVVEVHVDPKDFVSIPYDYYQTYEGEQVPAKARVCEYKVINAIDYNNLKPNRYYEEYVDSLEDE